MMNGKFIIDMRDGVWRWRCRFVDVSIDTTFSDNIKATGVQVQLAPDKPAIDDHFVATPP